MTPKPPIEVYALSGKELRNYLTNREGGLKRKART